MLRLWPVALVGVVLTLASAVIVGFTVSTSYEAKATLLLLSPSVTQDDEGEDVATNPFLLSGTAERVAASAVLVVTESEQWTAAMRDEGAEGDYDYELSEAAPIIEVRSAADTPDQALLTLEAATTLFRDRFEENQDLAGAPTDRLIRSEVLSSTVEPTTVVGSRVRAMAAVTVLGLVGTATVLFLIEAVAPGWQPHLRTVHPRRSIGRLTRPHRQQGSSPSVPRYGSERRGARSGQREPPPC